MSAIRLISHPPSRLDRSTLASALREHGHNSAVLLQWTWEWAAVVMRFSDWVRAGVAR
jgi:hypothetical protein